MNKSLTKSRFGIALASLGPPLCVMGALVVLNIAIVLLVKMAGMSIPTVVINDGQDTLIVSESEGELRLRLSLTRKGGLGSLVKIRDRGMLVETRPLTAQEGVDFRSVREVVTFRGATSHELSIPIINNDLVEGNRELLVKVSEAKGVAIPQDTIRILIHDDDTTDLTMEIARIVRAGSQPQETDLPIRLRVPFGFPCQVGFRTRDGTARAKVDFMHQEGEIQLQQGQSQFFVPLTLIGSCSQPTERQFWLDLELTRSERQGLQNKQRLLAASLPITVVYPGTEITVQVNDREVIAQPGTRSQALVTFSLNRSSVSPVCVQFQTEDGTAKAGVHYRPVEQAEITFPVGVTEVPFAIDLLSTPYDGLKREFFVKILSVDGTPYEGGRGTVTIVDPPPPPILRFQESEIHVRPQPGQQTTVSIVGELDKSNDWICTVEYFTEDDTAKAGIHYNSAKGTWTFPKGSKSQVIDLQVRGLEYGEDTKQFSVHFHKPLYLSLANDKVTVIIDRQPLLEGRILVVVPVTESLQQENILPAVAKALENQPSLIGGGPWLVDADRRLVSWKLDTSMTGLLPFSDKNAFDTFSTVCDTVTKLGPSLKEGTSHVLIIWFSDYNPDYQDLSRTVTIPESPVYACIWIRKDDPEILRMSRRLRHWFRDRADEVDPSKVEDSIKRMFLEFDRE